MGCRSSEPSTLGDDTAPSLPPSFRMFVTHVSQEGTMTHTRKARSRPLALSCPHVLVKCLLYAWHHSGCLEEFTIVALSLPWLHGVCDIFAWVKSRTYETCCNYLYFGLSVSLIHSCPGEEGDILSPEENI